MVTWSYGKKRKGRGAGRRMSRGESKQTHTHYLLGEHCARLLDARFVLGIVYVCVAYISGKERSRFPGHLSRDLERYAVAGFDHVLLPDEPQLLPMHVVLQADHDLRPAPDVLLVELFHCSGFLQQHVRHERSYGYPSAALQLEEVTFSTEDHPLREGARQPAGGCFLDVRRFDRAALEGNDIVGSRLARVKRMRLLVAGLLVHLR